MAHFVAKRLDFFVIGICPVFPFQCTLGGRESRFWNWTSPFLGLYGLSLQFSSPLRYLWPGRGYWLVVFICGCKWESPGGTLKKCTYPGPVPIQLDQNFWVVPRHWYLQKSTFWVIPLGNSTENPGATQKDPHSRMGMENCFHYTEPRNGQSLISHQASSISKQEEQVWTMQVGSPVY